MSATLAADLIAPRPHAGEAAVSVNVGEQDLRRLQVLASVTRVGEPGAGSFAELLSSTLHRGIVASYESAGLSCPGDPARAAAGSAAKDDAGSAGSGRQAARVAALIAAAATTVALLVGSYAAHWTWTGFTTNGQVWDWLQLLILPVAIGAFPLWLRFSPEMSAARRKALGAAVLAFVAFVAAGYLVPLTWTGFRGHTLWNWLTLIVLPITIAGAAVWPKLGRRPSPACCAGAAALGVAWIVTVIGGYAGHWGWTGYAGNTLWEWVQLLLAPIAITTVVVPELVKLVAGKVPDSGQGSQAPSAVA